MAPFRPIPLTLLILSYSLTATAQACYYPDGSVAKDYDYVPCTGSEYSSCCIPGEGDICLSNGLCYWQGNYPFRGSCTDQTWKSESCPKFCAQTGPSTWQQLVACGGTKYCCASSGSDCCTKANLIFDIGTPSVVNYYSVSSAAAATTKASLNILITATSSPSSSATISAASGLHTTSPNANGSNTAATTAGVGTGAIVGIVVGVVTFLVLIGAAGLAYYCVYKRKTKPHAQQPNLIDVHTPNTGVSTPATEYFAKGDYPASPAPGQAWDSAPPYPKQEYWQPYQVPPTDHSGNALIELQSPVARPQGQNGQRLHELA